MRISLARMVVLALTLIGGACCHHAPPPPINSGNVPPVCPACPPPPKPPLPETCADIARRTGLVPNRIEIAGFAGFGDRPTCVLPQKYGPLVSEVGAPTAVWARLVYADNINAPVSNRAVALSVINSFGEIVTDEVLATKATRTGPDGFLVEPIVLRPSQMGAYRLEMQYDDRTRRATSLTPVLIVHARVLP